MTEETGTHEDPLVAQLFAEATDVGESGDRILSAAIEQVEDFGLRRFTVDDVARRAGVSRVTIYRYFPKRERLLEAVVLYELRRFLRGLEQVVSPLPTLEARLVEGFVAAILQLRRHRLLNRLLRTEPELILPVLTVNGGRVVAVVRVFIAGYARDEAARGGLPLSSDQIDGVSELLGRAVLSFLLTPESIVPMETEADLRAFAGGYLAPVLRHLASGDA